MSKYGTLSFTIGLLEAIRKGLHAEASDQMSEHIANLQKIARDIRYGGEWQGGPFEDVAEALELCADGRKCALCQRGAKKYGGSCTAELKEEAAAAIRMMGKTIKDLEKAQEAEEPKREPADWQKEIMQNAEQTFQWEREEE